MSATNRQRPQVQDYYEIMGVSPTASSEEVRQRYRFLAQAYHPDKFPDPLHKAEAEEAFKAVQEAYRTLSSPRRRAAYDLSRPAAAPRSRPPSSGRTRSPETPAPEPVKHPRRRKIYGLSLAQWIIAGILLVDLVVRDPILFADELVLIVLFFTIDKVIALFEGLFR